MSEEGMMHRSKPKTMFGDIRFNHGFKHFRLKSTEKATFEWRLATIDHNLRKYIERNMGNNNYKKLTADAFGTYMECKYGCIRAV